MAVREVNLMEFVEEADGISVVRGGGPQIRAWNGIRYKIGLSGHNVGSQNLSMNVAQVPVGAIAYAHIGGALCQRIAGRCMIPGPIGQEVATGSRR
ncbi:MAG: hypothetical protein AAF614_15125, partial [Chloroflexota bacterium]